MASAPLWTSNTVYLDDAQRLRGGYTTYGSVRNIPPLINHAVYLSIAQVSKISWISSSWEGYFSLQNIEFVLSSFRWCECPYDNAAGLIGNILLRKMKFLDSPSYFITFFLDHTFRHSEFQVNGKSQLSVVTKGQTLTWCHSLKIDGRIVFVLWRRLQNRRISHLPMWCTQNIAPFEPSWGQMAH